jgi:long-chain acyl-CoA synthetase
MRRAAEHQGGDAMEDRFTVAGQVRTGAETHPDAPMFVAGDVVVSRQAMLQRAAQVGRALEADGVEVGDRVAFVDRNGLAHFETLYGAALTGAVHVAVNWRLAPTEVAAVVADARPRVLVVSTDCLALCQPLLDGDRPAGLDRIVVVDSGPAGAGRGTHSGAADRADNLPSGTVDYDDWLADQPTDDPGHRPAEAEPVLQLYTSGTTGVPKGVMLSNANLAVAMANAGHVFAIDEDTVSLVAMPMFHIGGIGWALCAMSRGGRSVVLRDVDPVVLLDLVARHRVTETFVVPAVLMALLATPTLTSTDLSSLRCIFYGASPIAEDVLARCLERFGCGFAQVYGMTETTGAITLLPPEDHDPTGPRRHLLRSAGRALPQVELRVVDPDSNQPLPPDTVGEVQARSPYSMLGYFDRPEETAAVLLPDGWLRTGDAGRLDPEGYLFLSDRIKDMIVTGAENVYPAEVENVLLAHPRVLDAAVIGVPDDRWGETVKAVVVASGDGAADDLAAELIAWCRDRLAHFKCPTSVDLVDTLPRNPTGKILKRQLREPYWAGRERRVG